RLLTASKRPSHEFEPNSEAARLRKSFNLAQWLECSEPWPITAAAPQRICTVFPFVPRRQVAATCRTSFVVGKPTRDGQLVLLRQAVHGAGKRGYEWSWP